MKDFKINFQLQKIEDIQPFGEKGNYSLHWFGLTDASLWLNIGTQTVYEYSPYASKIFGEQLKYNDYYLSRFIEDFFGTFDFLTESVPEKLYNSIESFTSDMDKWENLHIDEPDEIFYKFYEGFNELYTCFGNRSFDSGHLTDGPQIGFFRCGNKIKIVWESSECSDGDESIWTAPQGSFEMSYDDFIISVKQFYNEFFAEMDKQVKRAVEKDFKEIDLDKQQLIAEHAERKNEFLNKLLLLENARNTTDWDKIMALYSKMEEEIK